jgi:hypothetical protein
MKNLLLLVLFGFSQMYSFAQCPGCVVDPTCTASPAAPALCPSTLPDAPVNEPFDLDVTFFMPQNFTDPGTGFDVTLGSITITSISGLPPGLSATVNETDNVYTITSDPASQRGCVKICGTPTTIGSYTISVNVIASVTSPISLDQPQSFTLPISVLPGGSGNSGFSISLNTGCDTLLTEFQALITSPSQPVEYSWDFGNGNTSNAFSPEPQLYDTAGVYMISLETRILDYILTNVNFTATGSNWCGDVEEVSLPFIGCTSSPDIYYQLTVSGSTQTSSSGDNSTNFSQSGMNSIITGSAFSIQFWDDDNGLPFGSPDDNLGTAVIQFTGPGTYPFNTNEGNGSVTIGTQVGLSFTNTDSVMVNASPASPVIFGTDTLFCAGDSAILTLPQAAFYQWSRDGIELLSANNDSLVAFDSGNYTAEIRSEQGCAAFSDTFTVQVEPYPYQPTFILNPITETFFYNPGLPYNWVWLLDGDTLEGSENAINYQPLVPGNYSIVASNGYCESYSEPVFFTNVGIEALPAELDALIYPVPFHSGLLHIELKTVSTEAVHVNLYDSQGKLLQSQIYKSGSDVLNFNPGELSGGMYFLQIGYGGKSMMHKLPVSN